MSARQIGVVPPPQTTLDARLARCDEILTDDLYTHPTSTLTSLSPGSQIP